MEKENNLIENYSVSGGLIFVGIIIISLINLDKSLFASNNIIFTLFGPTITIAGISGIIKPRNIFLITICNILSNIGNSNEEENTKKTNKVKQSKGKNNSQYVAQDSSTINVHKHYHKNKSKK